MGSEWVERTFSELCDITRGASPRPIHDWMAQAGIPWVKISDASSANSRFIESTRERIKFEAQRKSVTVHPGDLILSNSATPGIPMFLAIEACIHDGWLLLRNFRDLDKWFAYYLLLRDRPALVNQGNGSVFTNLKTEILKTHRVKLPPLPTQQKIASILGSLDDKIELNRKTAKTLEEMAQALFRSWFVDFDPVIDNALAAGNPIPPEFEQRAANRQEARARAAANGKPFGLPTDQSKLFPDGFEDSELGPIPIGWKVGMASDYYDVSIGRTPPRKEPKWFTDKASDTTWISIRDMGQSGVYVLDSSETLTSQALKKFNIKVLPAKTVIVSFKLTVGRVAITSCPSTTNEAIAHMVCRGSIPFAYTYCYFKSFRYDSLASTSSIATAVNSQSIKQIPVLLPDEGTLEIFKMLGESFLERILHAQQESKCLSILRDTLLPKLISGEIQVA